MQITLQWGKAYGIMCIGCMPFESSRERQRLHLKAVWVTFCAPREDSLSKYVIRIVSNLDQCPFYNLITW